MVVISLPAPISMPSVFTNFTLLNVLQNTPSRITLVKLDAFNGWRMILVSSLGVGMVLSFCGNFTQAPLSKMVKRKRKSILFRNTLLRT